MEVYSIFNFNYEVLSFKTKPLKLRSLLNVPHLYQFDMFFFKSGLHI